MKAGRLRHRVVLQYALASPQRSGQKTVSWHQLAEVSADVISLSGRKYQSQSSAAAEATHQISMRFRGDVSIENRVIFQGRHFEILFADNVDGRNRELRLQVKERIA